MAKNLAAFLSQNVQKTENVKYVASKRIVSDGKPVEWEIKAISPGKDDALKKACTKQVQVPGKKNSYTPELDMYLYLGKLAAACTVYPDLADAELQNSYGVMGEDALLKEILNIGEYNDYLTKVQEVNGFETSMSDLVEEAKN